MSSLATLGRVYHDLDEATYRAMPGLSYSGAKVLLDCPARYRYERNHPVVKREYDLGHVAHELILGKGSGFDVVDRADWRTNEAKHMRDDARARGLVPILRHEFEAAQGMADAIMDSAAGPLFADGEAEVSLSWTDEQTGTPLRGRIDWLHPNAIVDPKTCDKASPAAIRKAAYDYGYWIQHAAYTEGLMACGLDWRPMLFVFVETREPHLVTIVQPDDDAIAYGQRKWREAIDLFDACSATDSWPAYGTDIQTIGLPAWAK